MKKPSRLSLFSLSVPVILVMNLSAGMIHPEVGIVQKILNKNPETQIAESGPGSPGQETSYFGALTRQAVIKFQNAYAEDILIPAGLSSGNGSIGPLTRKKLLEIANNTPASQNSSQNTQNNPENKDFLEKYRVKESEKIDVYETDKRIANAQAAADALVNKNMASRKALSASALRAIMQKVSDANTLDTVYPQSALPGRKVLLSGVGLGAKNDIYFGTDYIIRDISSVAGTISLIIPSLPPKKYDLVIKNENGVTSSLPFVILSTTSPRVIIDSIRPAKIRYGEKIVIYGSGFSKNNNDIIMSSGGTIRGLSSPDGKTLTATIQPEKLKEVAKNGSGKNEFPIYFQIATDNGFAQQPASFIMSL